MGQAMAAAVCCRDGLGKSIELVNMNQVYFPRPPQSCRKPKRDCHRRELHGKNPRPVRAGLIEPGRTRGIKRDVMAVFRQSRAHGLRGFDGAPFDGIEGMNHMKQT